MKKSLLSTFGLLAVLATSPYALAAVDLRVTEAWPGNLGTDVTADWFEISNVGNTAWTAAGGPALYYNDASSSAGAVLIQGLTNIQAGASVIVVVGNAGNAYDFRTRWETSINLTNVEIGFVTGGAGLSQGGDGVALWVGGPSGTPTHQISFSDSLDNDSWDADPAVNAVSTVGNLSGAVTCLNNFQVVASPGRTASGGPLDANAPVISVALASQTQFNLPAGFNGAVSGVISDPTDPAATRGIDFVLSDVNHAVGSLTVTAVSANAAVVPNANLVLAGSGANRTLKITPVGVGFAIIAVTVTDPTSKTDTYYFSFAASAASSTPALSRYHTGASDASTAFTTGSSLFVANDEDQVIRRYNPGASGLPVATFDFNALLGRTKEADIEASIRSGNRIYWIGSHGNDNTGGVETNRHISFSTDLSGASLSYVNRYVGMRVDLVNWDNANGHGLGAAALGFAAGTGAGVAAISPDGFNIEGVALTAGGTVYLGFRAPLRAAAPQNSRALLVPVTNFRAVVDAGAGTMTFDAPVFLDLGGRAIRSISENGLGDFLIIAGPVGESGPPTFEFFLWDGNPANAPVLLASTLNNIAVNGGGSPETIVNFQGKLFAGATVDILLDNGSTIPYGNSAESKSLIANWQKFRSDSVTFTGLTPLSVTTLEDENNGIGVGGVSLREALETAETAQPGTPITFDAALSGGTIVLTNELVVDAAAFVDASALPHGITISGGNSNRVFQVTSSGSLTLNSLTISHGNAAGGNGGGVLNSSGTLTLVNCTLTGNTAANGGAVSSDTNLSDRQTRLTNCTLHGNTATARGGGFYNFDGRASLTHCTITENSAPAGQGGGIASYGDGVTPTELTGSILRENIAGDVDFIGGGLNSFTSFGGNLVGSGNATGDFNQAGDQVGSATPARLSPIGYYGGPTKTRHPLANSPALNAAAATTLTTDQRGFTRSVGTADIGAVEAGPVTLVNNVGDGAATATTLRKAITDVSTPGAVIRFDPAVFNGEVTDKIVFGSRISLGGKTIFIDASDISGGVTLDGGGTTKLFSVFFGSLLAIDSLTLTGGNAAGEAGGGIANFGTATAANCTFSGNSASYGGGIGSIYGILSIAGCTFFGNSAFEGGGVSSSTDLADPGVTFVNCTFHGNTATNRGGAIFNAGTASLTHCTVTGNSAPTGFGGGIASSGASPTRTRLIASLVRDNIAGDIDYVLGGVNSFGSLGNNLIGSGNATGNFNQSGDQVGTFNPVRLSPLGNYGGSTRTRHPLANSPALNAAGITALGTDQGGFARSIGAPDIGAVEAGPVTLVNNPGDSAAVATTLRKAIADAVTPGTVIRFDPGVFNGEPSDTILFGSEIVISGKSLFIDASSIPAGVTLDGNLAGRHLSLGSSATLTLDSFSLINGNSFNNVGGSILMGGGSSLNLYRCLFSANNAGTSIGGGVMSFDGKILAVNSTFAGNIASDGGAIWAQGPLELTHATLAGTNSGFYAVVSFAGSRLENSVIAGNSGNNIYEAGTLTQSGNNLIGGNPLLAPLGNYGGPTRTMPPLPGSPAIEGAMLLSTTPAADQRNAPRPGGPLPDLGAVEAVALGSLGLASADGDTIPDILEGPGGLYPHLSPFVNDSNVDTDGDGSSDANEIGNMTNLFDPNSSFRITDFDISFGPGFNNGAVEFTSFPGLHYTAEVSANVNFSSPRQISLGNPTFFLSAYNLFLAPNEQFLRIKRD